MMNERQREAVRYLNGPCLVIAGAGSGKTRVITHKIEHLIRSGQSAGSIAAITFTNKAAQEMSERLKPMLKSLSAETRPMVSTFHSLGVQMLRQDGASIGLKPRFSIIDANDAGALVQEALATTDRKLIRIAQSQISLWKNALVEPDEALATAANERLHQLARVYREYNATLTAYQSVDFDDLILVPTRMLRSQADVLQRWREKLRYFLVDEVQDTNACQYALLNLLVGPRGALTAVGDDDQSIYGWRGATLENLRNLERDYPNLHVIKLEQNYRSSGHILSAANQLITHNPKLHEKKLWSEFGPGDPVALFAYDNEEAEAESVIQRLQALKFERRGKFEDYAILYRGNHQARVFEQMLRKQKIPYVLSGGQSFFERSEIRDLIAYLRLLVNDDDDPAFIRAATTPKRGIGNATLQVLGEYCGQRKCSMFQGLFEAGFEARLPARQIAPLREFGDYINRLQWRASREPADQLVDDWIAAIEYRAYLFANNEDKIAAVKWQNVCDFIEWVKKRAGEQDEPTAGVGFGAGAKQAAGKGSTLIDVAQTISLITQLDRNAQDADAVRLTTIHASKGLEFPHVFVVGCEEGLLPHLGGLDDEEQASEESPARAGASSLGAPSATRIEEERRLMYVAITRAQKSLTLSWCKERGGRPAADAQTGKGPRRAVPIAREPSRFLAEIGMSARNPVTEPVTREQAQQKLGALRNLLKPK
jgi:ATP-dependent DNA helicase Rep